MKMASKPQITKLHILLNNLQLKDEKQSMLLALTNGRTSSSKEISFTEAKILIGRLCQCDPAERLKTIITQLAYQAGIIYGSTDTDQILNKAKLNIFLREKGTVKKELQQQSYPELRKTHRQMEAICRNVAASKDKKLADKAVINLLKELDLKTTND